MTTHAIEPGDYVLAALATWTIGGITFAAGAIVLLATGITRLAHTIRTSQRTKTLHTRAEQLEDTLRVAYDTSNRSEAARARAEAALARVRNAAALHRQDLISTAELHAIIGPCPDKPVPPATGSSWCGNRAAHDAHDWLDYATPKHCPGRDLSETLLGEPTEHGQEHGTADD